MDNLAPNYALMTLSDDYREFVKKVYANKIKRELPQMEAHGRIRVIECDVVFNDERDVEEIKVFVHMHDGGRLFFNEVALSFPSKTLLAKIALVQ